IDRVRRFNSDAIDVRLDLAWVSAELAYQRRDREMAVVLYADALNICNDAVDPLTYARLACDASMIFADAEHVATADSLLLKALALAHRSRDEFLLARIYSSLIVVRRITDTDREVSDLVASREKHLEATRRLGMIRIGVTSTDR